MWNPFRRQPDNAQVVEQLVALGDRLSQLEVKLNDLKLAQQETASVAIDTKQDQRKLLRAYTELEVDMTGLADKLSRQLRRIRTRAAGGPGDTKTGDPEFPELGEVEDDEALGAILASMKGDRRGA